MPEALPGELWEMDRQELDWLAIDLLRIAGKSGGRILLHRVNDDSRYLHHVYAADVAQRLNFAAITSTWHHPMEVAAVDLQRCVVQLFADMRTAVEVKVKVVAPEYSFIKNTIREEVTRQLNDRAIMALVA